jgi:hypothetical protein
MGLVVLIREPYELEANFHTLDEAEARVPEDWPKLHEVFDAAVIKRVEDCLGIIPKEERMRRFGEGIERIKRLWKQGSKQAT